MAHVAQRVDMQTVWGRIGATPEQVAAFCQRWDIRWLALFGSVLRDDFRPDSDIDALVEFAPNHSYSFFDLHDMEAELTHLFAREVELVTQKSLHRLIRASVLPLAETLYAER